MRSRILLADDSITIQKVVNLTFADEGIDVVAVSNGEMAEKRMNEVNPDLVLADIFMPGKNGYELCETIKKNPQFKRVPVVLLVGAFEPFDQGEAKRVRADGHLTKPFESRTLVETVRKLINASGKRTGPLPAMVPPQDLPEERADPLDTNPITPPPFTGETVTPEIPIEVSVPMSETSPLDIDYGAGPAASAPPLAQPVLVEAAPVQVETPIVRTTGALTSVGPGGVQHDDGAAESVEPASPAAPPVAPAAPAQVGVPSQFGQQANDLILDFDTSPEPQPPAPSAGTFEPAELLAVDFDQPISTAASNPPAATEQVLDVPVSAPVEAPQAIAAEPPAPAEPLSVAEPAAVVEPLSVPEQVAVAEPVAAAEPLSVAEPPAVATPSETAETLLTAEAPPSVPGPPVEPLTVVEAPVMATPFSVSEPFTVVEQPLSPSESQSISEPASHEPVVAEPLTIAEPSPAEPLHLDAPVPMAEPVYVPATVAEPVAADEPLSAVEALSVDQPLPVADQVLAADALQVAEPIGDPSSTHAEDPIQLDEPLGAVVSEPALLEQPAAFVSPASEAATEPVAPLVPDSVEPAVPEFLNTAFPMPGSHDSAGAALPGPEVAGPEVTGYAGGNGQPQLDVLMPPPVVPSIVETPDMHWDEPGVPAEPLTSTVADEPRPAEHFAGAQADQSAVEGHFTSSAMWTEEETRFTPIDIEAAAVEEPVEMPEPPAPLEQVAVEPPVEPLETGFAFSAPEPVVEPAETKPAPVEEQVPAASAAVEPEQQAVSPGVPPTMIDEIVRRVVAELSESVVREIAWEVVPDCVERVVSKVTREEVEKRI
jgi:CheY-like chemotaxis protein